MNQTAPDAKRTGATQAPTGERKRPANGLLTRFRCWVIWRPLNEAKQALFVVLVVVVVVIYPPYYKTGGWRQDQRAGRSPQHAPRPCRPPTSLRSGASVRLSHQPSPRRRRAFPGQRPEAQPSPALRFGPCTPQPPRCRPAIRRWLFPWTCQRQPPDVGTPVGPPL